MEIEDTYLRALELVRAWGRQGATLELRDDAGQTFLNFVAITPRDGAAPDSLTR